MAYYDVNKIFEQAKEVIVEHKLYFIEDVIAYIPISKPTFYDYFKVDSNEFNDIKELLDANRVTTKVALRKKLEAGDKAAEILALYKLIGTDEERRALSMQSIDHTTKGDKINYISLGSGKNPNETTS